MRLFSRKRGQAAEERAKMELLEQVEAQAKDLRERADVATYVMKHRDRRNHWQESIQQMITGAHP
jgi:hypothetical protein